jgi:glutaminyl-tRNA synthetase
VHWLGYDWGTDLYYASDYFDRLYDWAEGLIRTATPMSTTSRRRRSASTRHADRARQELAVPRPPVEENLDLFRRMKAGEFPNGARVLRAKIDMARPTSICAIP